MEQQFLPLGKTPASLITAILQAWLVVGSLDITAAIIHFLLRGGTSPLRLLQFVASGAMGQDAFTGGMTSGAVGLLFHYCIALIWTILFFLAAAKLPVLVENVAVSGVLYAVFVWVVMSFVVLPLSNTPKSPFNPIQAAIGACILIVCIGLPIAYFARKYFS
ncbi:MAG: hypothetical protein JNN25_14655 [Candidatus Kapabacteria bacterium]|nr:hypothetical protein [Candidatus Kapabacteria bacterium]